MTCTVLQKPSLSDGQYYSELFCLLPVVNLVQHPTIGAPFLDESTIVDTDVDNDFSQAGPLPHPQMFLSGPKR